MYDTYTVDTPENIEFSYDVAGIGSRFLAAVVDSLLIALAMAVVLFGAGLLRDSIGVLDGASESVIAALIILLVMVILWGYYIIFELVWSGQTPGKRLVGLRVVRDGGQPVTFLSVAIRNFIRLVDFLPAFYGIGVITMFIDTRSRRLGDFAAGTLVVRERQDVTLASLSAPAPARPAPTPTAPQGAPLPQANLISEQDYTLVQEFLRRRGELGREACQRLGVQLASGLQQKLALPQGGDAERFLEYAVAEFQRLRAEPADLPPSIPVLEPQPTPEPPPAPPAEGDQSERGA
ncbi:RDD family protein [Chloroflexia bacterium SDU3-3]|nr:RDD family protein [Chloroflexia bacterium SDU3-3]